MKLIAIALFAMLVGVGCDNKKDAAPAAGAKTEKAAEPPKVIPALAVAPATVAEADADDDLATTEDFEDEAAKEIDNATVDAEVEKLAKEIGE
jgi:hypothetical protein